MNAIIDYSTGFYMPVQKNTEPSKQSFEWKLYLKNEFRNYVKK